MYDRIGGGYDATRRADPGIAARLAFHLGCAAGERTLDLACGTGNYTTVLGGAGLLLTGLDASRRMLAAAYAKAPAGNWVLGDAAALPFRPASFAGALCTLAIHHFPALTPVVTEVHRVLRRGRFVIFTQDHAQTEGMWLREYFPGIVRQAIERMPGVDTVVEALQTVGFDHVATEPYEVEPDLQDLFLYSGKHHPERYLDERVRAGISAFALADPAEVAAGCARLAADLRSGRIAEVIEAARHAGGDYTFIVATKL
jgi:ubiquinone/menaquinone biosynthesis C-methylase UbiE